MLHNDQVGFESSLLVDFLIILPVVSVVVFGTCNKVCCRLISPVKKIVSQITVIHNVNGAAYIGILSTILTL